VPKRVEIKVLTLKNSWDSNSIWSRFFSVAIQAISQLGKICKVKEEESKKIKNRQSNGSESRNDGLKSGVKPERT